MKQDITVTKSNKSKVYITDEEIAEALSKPPSNEVLQEALDASNNLLEVKYKEIEKLKDEFEESDKRVTSAYQSGFIEGLRTAIRDLNGTK